MTYNTNQSADDAARIEGEVRHAYAVYGRATASLSLVSKARCEAIAASLDNCKLVEGANGVMEFSKVGPVDSGCAPPTTPLPNGWKSNAANGWNS